MEIRVKKRLAYGETLLLVGSMPTLGTWNPACAPACKWHAGDIWSAHIPSPCTRGATRFEFKYCIQRDANLIWEQGDNHAAVVPLHIPVDARINVTWASGGEVAFPSAAVSVNGVPSPPPTPAKESAVGGVAEERLAVAVAKVARGGGGEFVTFRMKYCVAKGERVYVLGSIPELGKWNKMHSPRLECVGDNFYEVCIFVPRDADHEMFEYKYFTRGMDGNRRWEQGDNRVARPFEKVGERVWDDRWEKIRIEFSIYYPAKETQIMHVTGDLEEIGAWYKPGPTRMELGRVGMLETDVEGRKWELRIWTKADTKPFSYRYILVDTASKQELWEREPNRRCDFDVTEAVVNGVRVLKDVNFVSEMMFDAVPPDMFIGPYPQSVSDVDAMAEGGVTGVFNVQTDEDFKHRGVQWDLLKKRYDQVGIKVVRYPIRDFDRDSLKSHLHGATHALDDLIQEGRKVYIHCTAGMGRAPACAVAYLCWVKQMNLVDAVAFVKKHRKVAVPNVPVLTDALKQAY